MTTEAPALDHLVYAAPDLEAGRRRIAELLGVEPEPGGSHPRWGTHNALVGLGGQRYLEVIAPDPDVPDPREPRPFGLDDLNVPRLASWAVRAADLETRCDRLRAAGIDPGTILDGSRELPEGGLLRWRLTDPAAVRAGGVVPFLIDWRDSAHPADSLTHPLELVELRARHPAPPAIGPVLEAVGVALTVEPGERPGLVAVMDGPRGRRELD